MKKVVLNMNEQKKYNVIKKLVETAGNKRRAAVELDCSLRHINRLIIGYLNHGKAFFLHGNHGRQPLHTINSDIKNLIVDLYNSKYFDCSYRLFTEYLETREGIFISESTAKNILNSEYILSPRAHRLTKKRVKKEIELKKQNASSQNVVSSLCSKILDIEDAHPRQPRSIYFGEEIQMDACEHRWFGKTKSFLHLAVDDATGYVLGAFFDKQETLFGYYQVTKQILTSYGIPYLIKTDRRTVFEYKKKKSPSLEEDSFTQFSYACSQLGITIESSSVPEFKPRVERMFESLQNRLIQELRLNGISDIVSANQFLTDYFVHFNERFALPISNHTKSVFEMQVDHENINLVLSVLTKRIVDSGHSIKYNNQFYQLIDSNGKAIYYAKGTECSVIKTLNNDLYACIDGDIYVLEVIDKVARQSENFDVVKVEIPRKRYIPSMNHPWRKESFEKFALKQAHRLEKEVS